MDLLVRSLMMAGCALFLFATNVAAQEDSACSSNETVIRFSHVTAEKGHPKGRAARALAERINQDLDGRVCMIVYPEATLFDDNQELFDAMRAGDVQMAAPSLSKMSGFSSKFQVFDLPFMFRDMIALIDFTYTDPATDLLRSIEPTGITGLAYWINGMRQISANVALNGPEDVRGLKFRIQGSPVGKAVYGLLGAQTETIAFSQVFAALDEGRIDGQENSWSNIYTKRFHTRQHSINETNHSVIAYAVIADARFWNDLPGGLRDELEQILLEVTHEYNRFAMQLDEVNRGKVMESETPVRRLFSTVRQSWIDAMRPVWTQFEGEIGAELINAAQDVSR